MRVALLGRSRLALAAGEAVRQAGHDLVLVATARAADYYDVAEDAFAALARTAGAEFLRGIDSSALSVLRDVRADIGVSVNWPALLPATVLTAFPRGVLNAHAGDLPRYRGNACPNWAILAGEDRVGLVIHEMAPEAVDAGAVVVRDAFPLGPDTYIGEIYEWLERRIPALFVEALAGLADGSLQPQPQSTDPCDSLRCYPRRPEDARIDWGQPAAVVHRLVRASSRPFGGAFAFLEGSRRVTVWRAALHDHHGPLLAVPGQVLHRVDGDPIVACGEGCLRLTAFDVEGESDPARARAAVAGSLRTRLT